MSTDQNKELVILWMEERNKGNWDIIPQLFIPDFIYHFASDPEPVRGRDKVKQMNVMLRNTFDFFTTPEPDLLIAEGDLVVHRATVRLKPKDPWRGNPPMDKEAIVASVDIYRIVGGRIVEQWNHPDTFSQMQQLGNFPTPE